MSAKPGKTSRRRAIAVSLGSGERRIVNRAAYEKRLEVDEFDIDLGSMLRSAGIWSSMSRALRSRIKRMPPLHVTTVTPVDIGSGRQPKR
ncbi:hypothetical protein [Agrobacterium tumefaciens]|uniref:hypothetical protein n=1 Tax=Agrobacterium tumefaciens TaxID=358 RepID=UPI003BA03791